MTAPTLPVHHTMEDGSRFYDRVNPDTQEIEQYWSVTTALSVKAKDGLKRWTAILAARRAMENIPMLLKSQRVEECGRTWHKTEPLGCGECPTCVQKWLQNFHYGESARRALEGSAVHDAIEHWIQTGTWWNAATLANLPAAGKGGTYAEHHPKIAEMLPPYLEQCERWVADHAIIPADFWGAEMTVYNHRHRYAGTADWILHLVPRNERSAKLVARLRGDLKDEPADVLGDCKSREGEGTTLYDDHPLQLAAYRRAETCRPSKDAQREFPMPPTHGAVVFQPRPDGYAFRPVRAGEAEFKAFLAFLDGWRWTVEDGPTSIQVATFPLPDGWSWPRHKQRDAPHVDAEPAPAPRPTTSRRGCPPGCTCGKHSRGRKATGAAAGSERVASATLDSLTKPPVDSLAARPPHPNSPFGDAIPF